MKTYLNSKQRQQFCQMAATQVSIEEIVNEWSRHDNMTSEERKYLRTAITCTNREMEKIVKRLSPEEGRRILRSAGNTCCVCIPRETSAQFKKRLEKEAQTEGIWVSRNALDAIIEMALCRGCSPCQMQDNKEECPLRNAMMELDVPVYDSSPAEGVCPWEITGGEA